MIKFKKNKLIEKTKKDISNQKKFKKISKIFFVSIIFVLSADYSISHYMDNKVKNVVSKEQRLEFENITNYKNRENFLNKRLNYNYYTEEKYQQDLKLINDFNKELKIELLTLYNTNDYIKKSFPQYENFDEFFKKYYEFNYAHYFTQYYLYKKNIGKDENYTYDRIKNNKTYYINNFFWGEILKNQLLSDKLFKDQSNINYSEIYNNIFNIKKNSKEQTLNLLSKDYLSSTSFSNKILLERLIIQNEIPSFQLSSIYINKINKGKFDYKYQKGGKQLFKPNIAKEGLNYNNKTKVMKKEIDDSINNYFFNKAPTLNPKNIRNTLMILNAQSEYENNMLKIIDIKEKNKKEFKDINYTSYNYISIFNYKISNFIKSINESPKKEKIIYNFIEYKNNNNNKQIDYFLSGINDNNIKTSYRNEKLILETRISDYYYK